MPFSKNSPFDVTVVQRGDVYIVSGKDAPALHAKISSLPNEVQNLVIGPLENGQFMLQKMQQQKTG